MYKNFKLLNYVIYILLLFYLFVDTITGISLKLTGISFSIPYKIFLISLMILVIGIYNSKEFIIVLSLLTWLVFAVLVMYFFGGHNFSLAIQTYIKTISVIIFYFYFKNFVLFEKQYNIYLKRVLIVNACVFSANIIAGILGFGYNTYHYGVGIKGFFYAGNEIFLILLAITTLLLKCNDKKIRFCTGVIAMFFSVLIGTKTAILAIMIIVSVSVFINLKSRTKFIIIIFIPLILVLFILFFNSFLSSLPVFSNMIYNYNKNIKAGGNIVSALLSGRLDFLKNNLTYFSNETDFIHFIFGGNGYFNNKNVEIDFFDSLILNGSVLSVILLFFYFFLLFKSSKKKETTLSFLNFTVIMVSFTAGHIWANLTGGIFLIIANIVPNIFETINKKRRKNYAFKI